MFVYLVGFENSLCILDTYLSGGLHIFPSLWLLFHFLSIVSFEEKFLTLIKFSLSFFPFMAHAFDVISKKSSPNPRSQNFFLELNSTERHFYYMAESLDVLLYIRHFSSPSLRRLLSWASSNCQKKNNKTSTASVLEIWSQVSSSG